VHAVSKAWVQIHACVLLWGFTAIIGKLITLPAVQLVWWRVWLVALMLAVAPRVWRGVRAMPRGLVAAYAGIGVLVGLHWLAFYGSIKLANASVAVICLALQPVFLALVEPAITRRRFEIRELCLGIIAVPAVALVIGGTPAGMRAGIGAGILAAVFATFFSAFNKRLVGHADALSVTAIEMSASAVFMTVLLPLFVTNGPMFVIPGAWDAILLLVLAIACTLLPFALSLVALRHVTAFGTALAVNMEPVYAILLAIVLLGEQRELNAQFYLGVALILALVFSYPLLARARGAR
jgi:drug/metabolite transporter (DMT)-like permease